MENQKTSKKTFENRVKKLAKLNGWEIDDKIWKSQITGEFSVQIYVWKVTKWSSNSGWHIADCTNQKDAEELKSIIEKVDFNAKIFDDYTKDSFKVRIEKLKKRITESEINHLFHTPLVEFKSGLKIA